MNAVPEPHTDDFVMEIPGGRSLLCDRDVLPIRDAVSEILVGGDAPLEWLTLKNVNKVLTTYRSLKSAVSKKLKAEVKGDGISVALAERIQMLRWKLVSRVTESLYGDRKHRAAKLSRLSHKTLYEHARVRKVRGYTRMSKRDLVYALAALGLG
jgi:hypothetical protein